MQHVAVDISESSIDTIVTNGKFPVVDAHLMKDRCMNIIDLSRILAVQWFIPPLI